MSELKFRLLVFALLLCACGFLDAKNKHHYSGKQALKFLKSHHRISRNSTSNTGLWPSVFNLATKAVISVNATCGETGREEFCRTAEHGKGRCGYCDNFSADPAKRHSIQFAIDGSNRWWQSPSLYYGRDYEYVTIDIDLKQIYQIAYIIIKAANSPRPGTWILERSVNGLNYQPWQYYARNDKECLERFGIPATKGKPHYFTDSEVICTSFHSRFMPIEHGEIHTSLVHGRPGANESSPELLEFTKARFVRIRLMGLRGTMEPLPRWFTQDISRDKRLFYSIKDISIGGQCVCNGHAENCRHNVASGHPECECAHHTCGSNCDKCCPMFNQRQWAQGTSRDGHRCLPCNCHGHASSCHYDQDVDKAGLSMDIHGNYQGGGVCDNCTSFTTGINCEKCIPGYYRPLTISPDATEPCLQCDCDPYGSNGQCIQEGQLAGKCQCKPGYEGAKCDRCAPTFRGFPNCETCPCDPKGTMPMENCDGECVCKLNVEGKFCDRCKLGYFGLEENNEEGCTSCFCSGVTTLCESAIIKPQKIQDLNGWLISDIRATHFIVPVSGEKAIFSVGNYELPGIESLYWLAPEAYLGNKLEAYNANMRFKVEWVVMRGDTSGEPTVGPNIILVGTNGRQIAFGDDIYISTSMEFNIKLKEEGWYHLPTNIIDITTRTKKHLYKGPPVTRNEFMSILKNVKRILLRSSFHTDQIEALLEEAVISLGEEVDDYGFGGVEKCSCSSGYTGLSCEKCAFGFVRIFANDSEGIEQGYCGKCDCNGHSETCNASTGECFCQHNTIGEKCERCAVGFYGNPLHGTREDCKKCACPLENDENNFSPGCQLDDLDGSSEDSYFCTQCPMGYTGNHCEICDDRFYGNPMERGNSCQPCECNGGPCDRLTGQCLSCKGNTEGWKCERCKPDHYGDPVVSNCKDCECDPLGSLSKQCDNRTGQCLCKDRFTGRTCDVCESGYGNVTGLCTACNCNPIGSKSLTCDPHTGICDCRPGVDGFHCDACQNMYYGFSEEGCKPCMCDPIGSISSNCDEYGKCRCKPLFTDDKCDRCVKGYFRNNRSGSCSPCKCNPDGSMDKDCDSNGQCTCNPGVTGLHCDKCMPDHYGNIKDGCKKCDVCNLPGHICNMRTGKCECPENTILPDCSKCSPNYWGYEPGMACKFCDCSKTGSMSQQCDLMNGICSCKVGYEGDKCNRCADTYFGYPKCQPCKCNKAGSINDVCDANGQCSCKILVEGLKCDQCKFETFGLAHNNPKGCTDCFCMGRSEVCSNANYVWEKVRTTSLKPEENLSICHLAPCWSLPARFLGDLTTSYGGYLSAISSGPFDVYLENTKGILIRNHRPVNDEIKFEGNNWWAIHVPTHLLSEWPAECNNTTLMRHCLMVLLQSVRAIRIEAHHHSIIINEVLMDKAKKTTYHTSLSHTVEKCDCPPQYSGLSCQDPSPGYYRNFPKTGNFVDRIVGEAQKCDCNGKSNSCDPVTGFCEDCGENTSGPHCENCAAGFYKDLMSGRCEACLCPSKDINNAERCEVLSTGGFRCLCKEGYKGDKCEECTEDYYQKDGKCVACNCNRNTTISGRCENGVCDCKPGFIGATCSACNNSREYIKDDVCTPCDQCTQLLFQEIDKLSYGIEDTLDLFKGGIGPPWKKLTQTMDKHGLLSQKYKDTNQRLKTLFENVDLDDYDDSIADLQDRVYEAQDFSANNKQKVSNLLENSTQIQDEIEDLKARLRKIMVDLNIFSTKQVDVNLAIEEANRILVKITEIANRFAPNLYDNQLKKCSDVIEKVNEVYADDNMSPKKFNKLLEKLEDLAKINKDIQRMYTSAKEKTNRNRKRWEILLVKIGENLNIKNNNENDLKYSAKKLQAASDALDQVDLTYQSLQNLDLDPLYSELQKRQIDDVLYDSLDETEEHVRNLNQTIKYYETLFNFTKEEKKKINAGEAYMKIVNEIRDFTVTAKDAQIQAKKATQMLNPNGTDSLEDLAQLSNAYSDRLSKRISNLKMFEKEPYKTVRDKIIELKYVLLKTGKDNNALTDNMTTIATKILDPEQRKQLEEAIANSTNVSDYMQRLSSKVYSLNYSSQYDLFKDYEKYFKLLSQNEINDFKRQYAPQLDHVLNISLLDDIKAKFSNYSILNKNNSLERITSKLESLQNKITEARQIVSSLGVYLSLNNCERKYSPIQDELFETFFMQYNCTIKSCNLPTLKFHNNASIKLKVASGSEKLNVDVQTRNYNRTYVVQRSSGIDHVNFIEFIRFGQNLKLKTEVAAVLIPEVINGTDSIREISLKNNEKVDGVLYTMRYNQHNLGVWSFKEQKGTCMGAKVNQLPTSFSALQFWDGKGYGNYTSKTKTKKNKAFIFRYQTFDENSLIFLSVDEKDCSYMALYIKNGKLVFEMNKNGEKFVQETSRVNTGKEETVDFKYDFRNAKKPVIKLQQIFYPETKSLFYVSQETRQYLAGVNPNFKCLGQLKFPTRSFLGYLKETEDLDLIRSSGDTSNVPFSFSKFWLRDKGELTLNFGIQTFKELGFFLRPFGFKNGFVMEIMGWVRLKLKEGVLEVLDLDDEVVGSGGMLVDDDYNFIVLSVKDKGTLTVNNRVVDCDFPDRSEEVLSFEFGGESNSFVGGVYQLVLDNEKKLLLHNGTVEDFINVDIGRELPMKPRKVTPRADKKMDTMQNTESCISFPPENFLKDAVKFGDRKNSFVEIPNIDMRKNFSFYLEFRTYYPSGMLLFAEGAKNKPHHFLLNLNNGKLNLQIKGKRQLKEINLNSLVNDGEWHNITITKRRQKKKLSISIILDGVSNNLVPINAFNVQKKLLMGGIPAEYSFNNLTLYQFRGCVKTFKVNKVEKKLNSSKNKNIGKCFSKVENAAYFDGKAYAVYKKDFKVIGNLVINFQFRTSEQNGVIFRVPNKDNNRALSIELVNGAMMMFVDMTSGLTNVSNVDGNSEFSLCDNQWHNVSAYYQSQELTVIVDGITKTWVQNDRMNEIVAPLYIGGFRGSSTSKQKNFLGCIRNIQIDESITDWTDMEELNNIMLNSCPIADS